MISRKVANVLLAGVLITLFKLSALGSGPRPPGSLSLAWDPSPDPTVAGYRLYQGSESQAYTNVVDIGQTTTATISGLIAGATYYFAVTAYDSSGLESTFSGEIDYTVPTSAPRPPSLIARMSVTQTASGQTALMGTGPTGSVYDVLATQDLSSWLPIGSVTVSEDGSFQFTDGDSVMVPSRFYRLRQSTTQPATTDQTSGSPTAIRRPGGL